MHLGATIGIIGGSGWLGSAIARALVDSGTLRPEQLILSGRTGRKPVHEIAGAFLTGDNEELLRLCDTVILSVRPDQFRDLRIEAGERLVVSVMAGVPLHRIAAQTGASQIVRAMPNAAAAIRRSFTPWFAAEAVTAENRLLVQALLAACGDAAEMPEEAHIDYCAGLTGSGAAFPALLAEALVAHAMAHGLPEDLAKRAARSVVADASQLFAAKDGDPSAIVREMIEYGGTTAAALKAMLDHGFAQSVAAGLEAAMLRSSSLQS